MKDVLSGGGSKWRLAAVVLTVYATTISYLHFSADSSDETVASEKKPDKAANRPFKQIRRAVKNRKDIEFDLIGKLQRGGSDILIIQVLRNLGVVGGEPAVEAIKPFLKQKSYGVSSAAIAALGKIGTENAVSVLLEIVDGKRSHLTSNAIQALGSTGSQVGKDRLLELALSPGLHRASAIQALGLMGGDGVVAALEKAIEEQNGNLSPSIAAAAHTLGTEDGKELLWKLAHSGVRQSVNAAIAEMPLDEPRFREFIMAQVYSSDPAHVQTALRRMIELGEEGTEILSDVALSGSRQNKLNAIYALGEIGTPRSIEVLGEIFSNGGATMDAAATALARSESPETLVSLVANAPRSRRLVGLRNLVGATGDEVDVLFMELAESRSSQERLLALQHFGYTENPMAQELALRMAKRGGTQRDQAMWILSQSPGTSEVETALFDAARQPGNRGWSAISALASSHGGDPRLTELLTDKLHGGDTNDAIQASRHLVESGAPSSKEILMEALQGDSKAGVRAAAHVILQVDESPEVRESLLEVARETKSKDLKAQIVGSLLEVGAEEGLSLAREALEGDDDDLAASVLNGFYSVLDTNEDAQELLASTIANSKSDRVRASAIDTLTYSADPSGFTETYAEMMADPSASVRASAARALVVADTDESVGHLTQQYQSASLERKLEMIGPLSNSERPNAQQEIIRAIQSGDKELALAAIQHASMSGPSRDAVIDTLFSENNELAMAAAQTLNWQIEDLEDSARERIRELVPAPIVNGP